MLLRFSVENFACFAELTTLSMVASADASHPTHLLSWSDARGRRVLRLAAIFGANCHGKTQFVEAAVALRRLVLDGAGVERPLPHNPFRLDSAYSGRPSRFEIVFETAGAVFEYGIVHDAARIHDEWLFAREGAGREAAVFVRTTGPDGTTCVKAGKAAPKSRRGLFTALAAGTRVSQPFLTEVAEWNEEHFAAVRRWFSDVLVPIPATANHDTLSGPDLGAGNSGREPADTLRLATVSPISGAVQGNRVYLIDEIDRSLPPLLAREFIARFSDAAPEAQLVFTTHNTPLLNSGALRRDEIWFASKDTRGAASLASLAEFRVPRDLEIEKGYLLGRFSAIPTLGNLSGASGR